MPRTTRRRRSYGRRPARTSAKNYSIHKVITRGSTTLNAGDGNDVALTNVLATAEASDYYGKDLATRGNSVVKVIGNFWWWTDAPADITQVQAWLGVGLISLNTDIASQLDTEGERSQVGPLDLEGRYRPWHYRRTLPVISRGSFDTGGPRYDQAQQMIESRTPIVTRRAEKFMSVRDNYYLYAQTDADFTVGLAWQFNTYIREP